MCVCVYISNLAATVVSAEGREREREVGLELLRVVLKKLFI